MEVRQRGAGGAASDEFYAPPVDDRKKQRCAHVTLMVGTNVHVLGRILDARLPRGMGTSVPLGGGHTAFVPQEVMYFFGIATLALLYLLYRSFTS